MTRRDDDGRDDEDEDEDDDAPEDPDDASPRVTPAELRAYLALPGTLAAARRKVGRKVKEQDVDDLVYGAIADALATDAEGLPRQARMPAWFRRILRNRVADRHRKGARRKKYEGAMPEATGPRDEAGEPVADAGDAVKDPDPRVDPAQPDVRAEGWLLRRWMRGQVAGDPADRQTWAILEQAADADDKLTYKELAALHGMTEAQLYKRIERFKVKYREPYEKWRNGVFMLLLRWGAAAVAVAAAAWIAWWLLQPRIRRDPEENRAPAPVPSLSAAPSDTPFEQALPPSAEPPEPAPEPPNAPKR